MRPTSVSIVCAGMRAWVLCALLAGCHDAKTDIEHKDLADEMFSTATVYTSTMCRCTTAACAEELDGRFQSWLRQMQAKVADSDRHSSYAATIGEDGAKRFEAILAEYQSCHDELVIRHAIGR